MQGRKEEGEKQLKNIPEQHSYFGILIYKKKRGRKTEMKAKTPWPALVRMKY